MEGVLNDCGRENGSSIFVGSKKHIMDRRSPRRGAQPPLYEEGRCTRTFVVASTVAKCGDSSRKNCGIGGGGIPRSQEADCWAAADCGSAALRQTSRAWRTHVSAGS